MLSLGLGGVALAALVLAHRAPIMVRDASVGLLTTSTARSCCSWRRPPCSKGYDRFILSLALPYIASDLGMSRRARARKPPKGRSAGRCPLIRMGALLACRSA